MAAQDPTQVTTTLLHHAADPFRLLVESVKDYAIYMLDPEGRIASWNTGAERIKGFTGEEVLGHPFGIMFTAEDAAAGKPQRDLDAALTHGRFEDEGQRTRKDGSTFWAIYTITALHEVGRHVGFAVVVRDISDRKQRELEMRFGERRLELALDAGKMGLWEWDIRSNRAYWSPREYELLGLTPGEEPPGLDLFYRHVHPDDLPGLRQKVSGVLHHGTHLECEFRVVRAGGETRWLGGWGLVVRDEATGEAVQMAGVNFDITERKEYEQRLRASEERFRTFMDHTPAQVWIDDEDGVNRFANAALARELRRPVEEIIGRTLAELMPDAPLTDYLDSDRRVIESGEYFQTVIAAPRHDGGLGWFLIHKFPVGLSADGRRQVGGVAIDVTEREQAVEALRASEERLRWIVDGVKDHAMFLLDPEGRVASWNDAAARLYGYTAAEIVGRHRSRFFTPEDVASGLPQHELDVAAATGKFSEEGWRVRRDNTRFWANGTMTALREPGGALRGFVKVVRDLTEGKRVEDDLRVSEARFRTLITAMSQVVWTTDPTGEQVHTTPPWSEFTGLPEEEVRGWGWVRAVHPDDRDRAAAAWRHSLEMKERYDTQYRVRRADGEWRHFVARAVPLFDPTGAVREWVGVCLDETERVRAELELHASQEQLRIRDRAVQAVSSAILITDPNQPDNPIIFANPAFEKITRYSTAEAVGHNCRFLQGKDTDQDVVTQIREAVAAGRQHDVELLNYRKDGMPFWNQLTVSPVFDQAGQLTHFIGVQTDVTERRNLEQQLQQAQKMEAVGRLAGGVAHDFNNMLAVINGYSELLLQFSGVAGDPTLRNPLEEIHKAGERAAGLTRQLLAFSRKQVLEPKILDLGDLAKEMEGMLRRLLGEDIALHVAAAADLNRVKADPGQVEQVLLNLVVNSRDAMPTGGKLTVEVQNAELDESYAREHAYVAPGSYVMLAVTDTGCGMTAETIEQIFEPFFTTKDVGQGTGLGLSTVFGIVKQSGGHIQVYSEPGYGTTFKVYLPRTEDRPVAADASERAVLDGTETVLLVEDEEMVRTLVRNVLEMYGYTVLSAEDGEHAVALAQEHGGRLDLLLSDVVMPGGISGRVVGEQLKAARPDLRVLFMSGYTDDAVVRHGIIEAETAFIQKPFTPLALARKVREVLG